MLQPIPKTTEHTHTDHDGVWTDAKLVAHVKEHHDLGDQPYLTNKSNITLLMTVHAQAHQTDPIRFKI